MPHEDYTTQITIQRGQIKPPLLTARHNRIYKASTATEPHNVPHALLITSFSIIIRGDDYEYVLILLWKKIIVLTGGMNCRWFHSHKILGYRSGFRTPLLKCLLFHQNTSQAKDWRDGSVNKNACCTCMRTWVCNPRTQITNQAWPHAHVMPVLVGCQPSSIQWVLCTCTCTCTYVPHVHMIKKSPVDLWLSQVIQIAVLQTWVLMDTP